MHSIAHLTNIWIAAVKAIIRTTFSRLLLGATLPSWTWRTEWAIAFSRDAIATAAEYRDDPVLASIGMRVRVPLSSAVVGAVHITRWSDGSRSGDSYTRVGSSEPKPTILYFHGGGYAFGNPGTHREHIARLVERTGARVIAPRYRLAPSDRFPAALEDAIESYRRLLDDGIDAGRLIVAGDSAGAGLAVGMVHRARAASLPMPAGLMLFSPYVDLAHTAYTLTTNAHTDYLPVREMTAPNDWYVTPEDRSHPEASPVNADLSGFPPMLIHAGAAEMLLADSIKLAEHAQRDSVPVELLIAEDMPHVWPAIAPWEPASKLTLEQCAQWIPTVTKS